MTLLPSLALALACLVMVGPSCAAAQSTLPARGTPAVPAVSALRVQLFENKSGSWTDDVLATPPAGSWNSRAGPHASDTTLIIIEVRGQADANYSGRAGAAARYVLRLVATERARPLLDQSQPLPVMGPDGKAHVAFLVRPSGCAPLRLRASMVGRHTAQATEVVVPFACGE